MNVGTVTPVGGDEEPGVVGTTNRPGYSTTPRPHRSRRPSSTRTRTASWCAVRSTITERWSGRALRSPLSPAARARGPPWRPRPSRRRRRRPCSGSALPRVTSKWKSIGGIPASPTGSWPSCTPSPRGATDLIDARELADRRPAGDVCDARAIRSSPTASISASSSSCS